MTDSIIAGLREFIATCPNLENGALLNINSLGAEPIQYSIVPQTGERVIETYLNDVELCEYPFALQSVESTADNLARIETSEFYESFAAWLKSSSNSGTLPSLPTKHTAKSIRATGWASLFEQGVSDTGIYMIQCKLIYELQP